MSRRTTFVTLLIVSTLHGGMALGQQKGRGAPKTLAQRSDAVLFRALRWHNRPMARARLQRHQDTKALVELQHDTRYGFASDDYRDPGGQWFNQVLKQQVSPEVVGDTRAKVEEVKGWLGTRHEDKTSRSERVRIAAELHDKAAHRHPQLEQVKGKMSAIETELGGRMDQEFLGTREAFAATLESGPPERLRLAATKMIRELGTLVASMDVRRDKAGELSASSSSSSSSRGLLSSRHSSSTSGVAIGLSQFLPENVDYKVSVGDRHSTMDGRRIAHTLADIYQIVRALEDRAPEMARPLSRWLDTARFEFTVLADRKEKVEDWQEAPAAPESIPVTIHAARAPEDLGQLAAHGILSARVSRAIRGPVREAEGKLQLNPLLGQ